MAIKRFSGLGDIVKSVNDDIRRAVATVTSKLSTFDRPATHAVPAAFDKVTPNRPKLGKLIIKQAKQPPQILSKTSQPAPYETLFHELELEAVPFYNFWTEDEKISEGAPRGDRKMADIPRFIKLSWNEAPDLPALSGFIPSDKSSRTIKPVKFGLQNQQGHSSTLKGISFAPDHLQPKNFAMVASSLANGFMSPGVLHSLVELPPSDKVPMRAQATTVDEDMFLTSPATRGLSIHEIRASIDQVSSGLLGAGRVSAAAVDQRADSQRGTFFDGKFFVSSATRLGERSSDVEVRDVNSSPALSFKAKTANSAQTADTDHMVALARQVSTPEALTDQGRSTMTKVAFVRPSVGAVVTEQKVQRLRRPEHAENVVSLARFLPNLEVFIRSGMADMARRDDIPSFASPANVPPLEYVGYIIEKYRRTGGGSFELVKEILVGDRSTKEFYDCEIKYGEMYRYRIRTVLRWTRPNDVGQSGRARFTVSQNGSQTAAVLSQKSSYIGGEWNKGWLYATCVDNIPPPPPDELTVRAESARRRVVITFRMPDDSQLDIKTLRLLRKLQDVSGRDLTDWEQLGRDFGPRNVLYYDEDVELDADGVPDPSVRYVYSALTVSKHAEVSHLSEQLGVRLNPDYKLRGEFGVDFISCAGVRREYVGAFSTSPMRRDKSEVHAVPPRYTTSDEDPRAVIVVSGREAMGTVSMDGARYVLRIESLDTGERHDVPVTLTYNNQKERVDIRSSTIAVKRKQKPPAIIKKLKMTAALPLAKAVFKVRR